MLKLTPAVRDPFWLDLGVDTKVGADELAKALADPARGADELNARLSFLDDRTRQYVRTLAEQNNRSEAQRVILAALVPALADAEQATNAFGRAWNYVARQASNAFDVVGRAVDRTVSGRTPAEELDLLRYQRDRLQENGRRAGFVPLALPAVERRIGELEAQLRAQEERAAKVAAEARANALSVRAGEVARDVVPGARELERLLQQQRGLRAALDDPLTRREARRCRPSRGGLPARHGSHRHLPADGRGCRPLHAGADLGERGLDPRDTRVGRGLPSGCRSRRAGRGSADGAGRGSS